MDSTIPLEKRGVNKSKNFLDIFWPFRISFCATYRQEYELRTSSRDDLQSTSACSARALLIWFMLICISTTVIQNCSTIATKGMILTLLIPEFILILLFFFLIYYSRHDLYFMCGIEPTASNHTNVHVCLSLTLVLLFFPPITHTHITKDLIMIGSYHSLIGPSSYYCYHDATSY